MHSNTHKIMFAIEFFDECNTLIIFKTKFKATHKRAVYTR